VLSPGSGRIVYLLFGTLLQEGRIAGDDENIAGRMTDDLFRDAAHEQPFQPCFAV